MWIELIGHDLRFAARQMKRSPGFTAIALAAIALGVGANSAVFSFFNAIYLRTAAVAQADQLVALHRVEQDGAGARETLSAAHYEYLRALIVRRGLFAATAGLAAGTLIAWQAAPVLTGLLYGVEPGDAATFGAVIAVLCVVALTASFLPARRVSGIDPAVALRDQ